MLIIQGGGERVRGAKAGEAQQVGVGMGGGQEWGVLVGRAGSKPSKPGCQNMFGAGQRKRGLQGKG